MPKNDFVEYVVKDLLSEVEGVKARAMFGGHGLYRHDTIFAIIVDEELYFKTDESNKPAYKKAGSEPFSYETTKGKRAVMSYWKVPSEILEDREALAEWADEAYHVSRRSKPGKKIS